MLVTDILEALEATTKRKAKEEILMANRDHEELRRFLQAALDPMRTFGIKNLELADSSPAARDEHTNLEMFHDLLQDLETRALTGNEAREVTAEFLSSLPAVQRKWFFRCLLKNLRCGVDEKTLREIMPGLLKVFLVQRAEEIRATELEKWDKFPVWCDYKIDGTRCVVRKAGKSVTMFSRGGHEITTVPSLKAILETLDFDFVLDCEIKGHAWNDTQSVLFSTKDRKSDADMYLNVFDHMTVAELDVQNCPTPYSTRRENAKAVLAALSNTRVRLVGGKVVHNRAELKKFYEEAVKLGHEGIMIKLLDAPYVFGKTSMILKVKPFSTWEAVIVGWSEGDQSAKWAGKFGAFKVQLDKKGPVFEVGGGFSDALREEIFGNLQKDNAYYDGKVAEVKGKELTPDGKVREPVFVRFRDLKDMPTT